jgi:tetratricopeptide (TPR) repeat protein
MYCPECGNDADEAKFCPECGANLAGVKDALSGQPAGAAEVSQSSKAEQGGAADEHTAAPAGGGPRRLSPAVIWGAFGALAVVVIVVVVMVSGGFGGGSGESGAASATGGEAVEAVSADTSGSYEELVQRANELYDQGDAAFQEQGLEQGSAYFAAAAEVYAAAWAKQATDPGVGTDFSVALFYSGDMEAALARIDEVLEANPDFQKGWLNKGIFLSHEARMIKQADAEQADKLYQQAKTALTKAVAIDPKSDAGKQADQSLQALTQEE